MNIHFSIHIGSLSISHDTFPQVRKIGDEYYSYLVQCRNPKACTIVLRGPSKDILNEMDRSLNDALNVARNIMLKPKLCPGGGAFEMAVAHAVSEKGKALTTVHQGPYRALAAALEVIPRTLIQNCGANIIRTLTALRAKHAAGEEADAWMWGVDGETGKLRHMKTDGVWEPLSVKNQVLKTATEVSTPFGLICSQLRIVLLCHLILPVICLGFNLLFI